MDFSRFAMKKTGSKKMIEDKIYLYGKISPNRSIIIQEAIYSGLLAARASLGVKKKTNVRVWVLGKTKGGMVCRAEANRRFINIEITKTYAHSRKIHKHLAGTVIHEYVHFLRLHADRHCTKTLADALIEEGIAIYVQSVIAQPPTYLDIKNLDETMVKICWEKLAQVIDSRFAKRHWEKIKNNNIYLAIYYRLAFGIVRRFVRLHPHTSLAKLLRSSGKKLVRFAHRAYGHAHA